MTALSIRLIIVEKTGFRTGTIELFGVQIPLFQGGKCPSERTINRLKPRPHLQFTILVRKIARGAGTYKIQATKRGYSILQKFASAPFGHPQGVTRSNRLIRAQWGNPRGVTRSNRLIRAQWGNLRGVTRSNRLIRAQWGNLRGVTRSNRLIRAQWGNLHGVIRSNHLKVTQVLVTVQKLLCQHFSSSSNLSDRLLSQYRTPQLLLKHHFLPLHYRTTSLTLSCLSRVSLNTC